jgi:hypothetical protein
MVTATFNAPRISTTRAIPQTRTAWRPSPVTLRAPQKATVIRALNWAGWLALLAIPVLIMVWASRPTPQERRVQAELQELERQETGALTAIGIRP